MIIKCNFFDIELDKLTPYTLKIQATGHINGVEQNIILEYSGTEVSFKRGAVHPNYLDGIKHVLNEVYGYGPFNKKSIPKYSAIYIKINDIDPENSTFSAV